MYLDREIVTESILITAQIEAAAALAWCELVRSWEAAKVRASDRHEAVIEAQGNGLTTAQSEAAAHARWCRLVRDWEAADRARAISAKARGHEVLIEAQGGGLHTARVMFDSNEVTS